MTSREGTSPCHSKTVKSNPHPRATLAGVSPKKFVPLSDLELVSRELTHTLLLCLPHRSSTVRCNPAPHLHRGHHRPPKGATLISGLASAVGTTQDGTQNTRIFPSGLVRGGCWVLSADCQNDPCSSYGLFHQQVLGDSSRVTGLTQTLRHRGTDRVNVFTAHKQRPRS